MNSSSASSLAWFGTLPNDLIAREILARVHIEERARFTSTCKYLYSELGRRARAFFGTSHLLLRAVRVYSGSTTCHTENPLDQSQILFLGYPTPESAIWPSGECVSAYTTRSHDIEYTAAFWGRELVERTPGPRALRQAALSAHITENATYQIDINHVPGNVSTITGLSYKRGRAYACAVEFGRVFRAHPADSHIAPLESISTQIQKFWTWISARFDDWRDVTYTLAFLNAVDVDDLLEAASAAAITQSSGDTCYAQCLNRITEIAGGIGVHSCRNGQRCGIRCPWQRLVRSADGHDSVPVLEHVSRVRLHASHFSANFAETVRDILKRVSAPREIVFCITGDCIAEADIPDFALATQEARRILLPNNLIVRAETSCVKCANGFYTGLVEGASSSGNRVLDSVLLQGAHTSRGVVRTALTGTQPPGLDLCWACAGHDPGPSDRSSLLPGVRVDNVRCMHTYVIRKPGRGIHVCDMVDALYIRPSSAPQRIELCAFVHEQPGEPSQEGAEMRRGPCRLKTVGSGFNIREAMLYIDAGIQTEADAVVAREAAHWLIERHWLGVPCNACMAKRAQKTTVAPHSASKRRKLSEGEEEDTR